MQEMGHNQTNRSFNWLFGRSGGEAGAGKSSFFPHHSVYVNRKSFGIKILTKKDFCEKSSETQTLEEVQFLLLYFCTLEVGAR